MIRVWSFLSANKGFFGRIANFVSYMLTATWAALWLRKVDVVVATSPQFFCGWAGVLCHWIRRAGRLCWKSATSGRNRLSPSER